MHSETRFSVGFIGLGDQGDGIRPGPVVVNHGTGTPLHAVRSAGFRAAAGAEFLDAPVSGGRQGAEARTPTSMVGGPEPVARRRDRLPDVARVLNP